MNSRIKAVMAAGLLITLGPTAANATTVTFDLDFLGGNSYRYTYEVLNDTLSESIDEFSIYFELGLYENLAIDGTPDGWDPLVFQPDPLLPDDGLYDAFALSALGIAPGEALGGFSVIFDWLGSDAPGSQIFEIIDSETFLAIDEGTTILRDEGGPGVPVPEPASSGLLMLGLMSIALSRILTSRRNRVSL